MVSRRLIYALIASHILCCICVFEKDRLPVDTNEDVNEPNLRDSEISALYDLYYSTNGTDWSWSTGTGDVWNFASDANPCADEWQGIVCSHEPNASYSYTSELSLPQFNLKGTVPSSMVNLTMLEYLDLSSNFLSQTLPHSVGNLTQLTHLLLNHNELTRTVPDVIGANLVLLQVLRLDNNKFTGLVPHMSPNLTHLGELDLSTNKFNGTIPSSLVALPALRSLSLASNDITGTVPAGMLNGRLAVLDLFENALHGLVPNITQLNLLLLYLDLGYNALTGRIPESFGLLQSIRGLYMNSNHLSDCLPDTLGVLQNLEYLDLSANIIHGTMPTTIDGLTKLVNLNLHGNLLTGAFPAGVSSLGMLVSLNLADNLLTGDLAAIDSLTRLSVVQVNDNYFSGTLPSMIGSTERVTSLNLSANMFTGSIPPTYAQLRKLQVLILENNQLSGALDNVFNASLQRNLTAVQLSNNQLTGSLPAEVFALRRLSVFAAVSNCFKGSIPDNVCNCSSLVTLALDGLQSAEACQRNLLPRLLVRTTSYTVSSPLSGGLPACLLSSLPLLATLHLSGNGLTGTLPRDISVSAALSDLTLSHNNLKGEIPEAIQSRRWSRLDLSYNRLGGTLSSHFSSEYPANASLYLDQNRLSGRIPSAMRNIPEISILGSNLFSCNADHSDLPRYNDDRNEYSCGSDSMNTSAVVWGAIAGLFCALLGVVWYCRDRFDIASVQRWWTVAEISTDRGAAVWGKLSNVTSSFEVYHIVLKTAAACTLFIVLFLLPLYLVCTKAYGTLTHQYAWVASAAYLSGKVPFALEFVVFALVVLVMFGSVRYCLHLRAAEAKAAPPVPSVQAHHYTRPSVLSYVMVYTVFVAVNFTVTAGANVAYVYVALYKSDSILSFAQLLLSLYKFTMNSLFSPYLIHLLSIWALRFTKQASADARFPVAEFVSVQLFVALFNNIAIPCIVTAIISPNCFIYAFRQAPAVTSSFKYVGGCSKTDNIEFGYSAAAVSCESYDILEASTSYSPPFKYTYQCSSSFITYYAPTFAILCIIASFAAPVGQVCIFLLHKYAPRGSLIHTFLALILPKSLRSLPGQTGDTDRDASGTTAPLDSYPPFFNASQQLVSLLSYLGMLLTFGVVFPPLAVAFLVTIACVIAFARLKLGRLLYNAAKLEQWGVLEEVNKESRGVGISWVLRRLVRIVLTFSATFYTMFLFDTLGEKEGFEDSYWVLIVVPLLPVFALLVYRCVRSGPTLGVVWDDGLTYRDTFFRDSTVDHDDIMNVMAPKSGNV